MRSRAFSLAELMIAAVILGLGLVMAATIFPVALDQHRQSAEQVSAMQAALTAKRLVQTHLVPHIDPLRGFRLAATWPSLLGPDPRDRNGDGIVDLQDRNGDNISELIPRGPIRRDPSSGTRTTITGPSLWNLLHFETIHDDNGTVGAVRPVTHPPDPTGAGISYAEELNGRLKIVEDRSSDLNLTTKSQRAAWFRINDMISPSIRFVDPARAVDPVANTNANLGPTPFDQVMATPSYVWYLFYHRPSDNPMSTELAYYVAVCRIEAGRRFAFQDLTPTSSGVPQTGTYFWVPPSPAELNVRSVLPIPWLVPVAREGDGFTEADAFGRATAWGGNDNLRLSTLAPRGSRLLGQRTGTVYTVINSPAVDDSTGQKIDVLPVPQTEDLNQNGELDDGEDTNRNDRIDALDLTLWIFPPPLVPGNNAGFLARSPFVTGLRF